MKFQPSTLLLAAALALGATSASAVTITFEELAPGTVLSNQYAAQGVTFTANAFTGAPWAPNTDMTIVNSAVGEESTRLGNPPLVSGNILHSYNGWLAEEGDASFRISFAQPADTFSITFAGVGTPADATIFVYDGATQIGSVSGTTTGQFVLSYMAASITSVVVRPGSFNDWVGVDNVSFTTAVPEPGSVALMGLGVALLALRRRQAR